MARGGFFGRKGRKQIMKQILLIFKDREDFVQRYSQEGADRGFFLEGHDKLSLADSVRLEIVFVKEVMVFQAVGEVLAVAEKSPHGKHVGIRIGFAKNTGQTILDFAQRKLVRELRRRPRRFAASFPVEISWEDTFLQEQTTDMSRSGAFILTQNLLSCGTLLAMRLRIPGKTESIKINAEVARHQTGPNTGIGVSFVVGDLNVQQKINRLIASLANAQDQTQTGTQTSSA